MKRVKRNEDAIRWKGSFPIYFTYTAGKAGEIFFENLRKKNVLTASECPECGTIYLPPRIYCEKCMVDVERFFEVPPEGEVEGTTEVYLDVMERKLKEPVKLALVRIKGTDGRLILRILDEVKPSDIVKIVIDKGEMKGVRKV